MHSSIIKASLLILSQLIPQRPRKNLSKFTERLKESPRQNLMKSISENPKRKSIRKSWLKLLVVITMVKYLKATSQAKPLTRRLKDWNSTTTWSSGTTYSTKIRLTKTKLVSLYSLKNSSETTPLTTLKMRAWRNKLIKSRIAFFSCLISYFT